MRAIFLQNKKVKYITKNGKCEYNEEKMKRMESIRRGRSSIRVVKYISNRLYCLSNVFHLYTTYLHIRIIKNYHLYSSITFGTIRGFPTSRLTYFPLSTACWLNKTPPQLVSIGLSLTFAFSVES